MAFIVLVAASPAVASPYDVGWGTFTFGLGGAPQISGGLDERLVRDGCDQGSCPLSSRLVLGGGLGRWGIELHVASNPVTDRAATDYRDRDRHALRVGPLARYTVFRRYGFDLSVRAGLQLGVLGGTESKQTMADPACPLEREGMCAPIVTTYDPDGYSLLALPFGATLKLGVRASDRGYFAVFADLDYTLARIGFPDDPRTGVLRTITYGVSFGSMFDLPR